MAKMIMRNLKCSLTDEEVDERAKKMAIGLRKYEEDDADAKARAKAAKEKLDAAWTQILAVRREVEERAEYREIGCTWGRDEYGKLMMLIRSDTGEVVESRPMTADDMQETLPLGRGRRKGEATITLSDEVHADDDEQ